MSTDDDDFAAVNSKLAEIAAASSTARCLDAIECGIE
jgi:hypothetical protein